MTSHLFLYCVSIFLCFKTILSAQRLTCESVNGYGQCYNFEERNFEFCWTCRIGESNLKIKNGEVEIIEQQLRLNVKQINFGGGTVDYLPMKEILKAFPKVDSFYINGTNTKAINDDFFGGINLKLNEVKEFRFEFSKNTVEIDANAFKAVKSLKVMLITNNNDLWIDSLAFSGLINLKELDLRSNKFENIETSWFKDLRDLENLFLSENKIRKLENGIFFNLKKLKILSLHSNKLKTLQKFIFAGNKDLEEIYLHSNQIKEIQTGTFSSLNNLNELSLIGNVCINKNFEDLAGIVIEKELKECLTEDSISFPSTYTSIVEPLEETFSNGADCLIPVIPNGKVLANKIVLAPNSIYTDYVFVGVNCNVDYSLVKVEDDGNEIICEDGQWEKQFPTCKKLCNINELSGITVKTSCHRDLVSINCNSNILPGTIVTVNCNDGYKTPMNQHVNKEFICLDSGKWSESSFRCSAHCGLLTPTATKLIYGGREASNITEVPWMAAIYRNNSHICGGTIISERLIVSAAHCWTDEYSRDALLLDTGIFKVGVGKYHRELEVHELFLPQILQVDVIIIPESYAGYNGYLESDIAVVVIKGLIIYKLHIAPVCLEFPKYSKQNILKNGTYAWVAGWGLTKPNGPQSKVLQKVQLPIVDYDSCKASAPQSYEPFVTQDKLCAGYINNNIAVCPGDSGGGLVTQKIIGSKIFHFLQGVVSNSQNSIGGCNTEFYTMFTDVHEYSTLIKSAQVKYRPE